MKKQRKKQDRREFLKKTAIGITGISLFRDLSKGKNQKSDEKKLNENGKIVYRTLGQTDYVDILYSHAVDSNDWLKNPVLPKGSVAS